MSGGVYDWEGTVYVRITGEWRGVCQNGFDLTDANVVCRQLGYGSAFQASAYKEVDSGDKYWLENLQCDGSENELCECPSNGIGQETCDVFEGVAVTCLC